jgi:hypothetical protein
MEARLASSGECADASAIRDLEKIKRVARALEHGDEHRSTPTLAKPEPLLQKAASKTRTLSTTAPRSGRD